MSKNQKQILDKSLALNITNIILQNIIYYIKLIIIKNMIISKIPTPKNISNHCVIDNFPLSAITCSSLFLSNKTIISPIMKKKKPQQNPAIREYPLFLCIKAQSIPIATNNIKDIIVILFAPFNYTAYFKIAFFCSGTTPRYTANKPISKTAK